MSKPVKGSLIRSNLPPIIGIFLTVFLDLLGFGLFIPDLQLRGKEFGASGVALGFTLGSFSLAQLLTSPILGRISDRYGRRSVLLITTLLSFVAYVVYAQATSLPWIVASRVVSGIAAANVGVAFAYVADITSDENRAKGMGTVGAAFGLGFIFGPIIGVALLSAGGNDPSLLGYVAASLSLLNFLYVLFLLPETAQQERQVGGPLLQNFGKAMRTPGLGILLLMFFAAQFGFTNLESTFFLLLADKDWIFALPESGHGWTSHARGAGGLLLLVVGIVNVLMQGYLVRKLLPRYGEVKLLRVAYFGMVPALLLTPFAPLWIPMLICIACLGLFAGLAQPTLTSLISRNTPPDVQGGVFGVTQSLGAVARFVGPLVSNPLFVKKAYLPYIAGAAIILIPALLAWNLRQPERLAARAEA